MHNYRLHKFGRQNRNNPRPRYHAAGEKIGKRYRIKTSEHFNLKYTYESGQPLTFHADYFSDNNEERLEYATRNGKAMIAFRQSNPSSLELLQSTDPKENPSLRFSLNDDMNKIYKRIQTDPFMEDAVNKFPGLRITRNDPWESTLCFVVSQLNNLKRIRGIMKKLISNYGSRTSANENLFPNPENLANLSIKQLMACGTGFRAKYIKSIASECTENGFSLSRLKRLNYDKAKQELMHFNGVGDKVADCILLFGYNRLEAFPIDTWVKRVVENVYFDGKEKKLNEIHDFAEDKWGKYAGYAQQYLFWHGRNMK